MNAILAKHSTKTTITNFQNENHVRNKRNFPYRIVNRFYNSAEKWSEIKIDSSNDAICMRRKNALVDKINLEIVSLLAI